MQHALPEALAAAGRDSDLYTDDNEVVYGIDCGELELKHGIVWEDGGLRVVMYAVDNKWDRRELDQPVREISTRSVSEIISEAQAIGFINRWSLLQRRDQGVEPDIRAPRP
jgi:hypothetical protein